MTSNPARPRTSGFALAETLVALLLLAIAMVGDGAALVESLAGQRQALLQTRAADLAANLAEALRSAGDPAAEAAEIEKWQASVRLQLPGVVQAVQPRPPLPLPATALPAGFDIHLQWLDGRSHNPAQLTLPLGFSLTSARS